MDQDDKETSIHTGKVEVRPSNELSLGGGGVEHGLVCVAGGDINGRKGRKVVISSSAAAVARGCLDKLTMPRLLTTFAWEVAAIGRQRRGLYVQGGRAVSQPARKGNAVEGLYTHHGVVRVGDRLVILGVELEMAQDSQSELDTRLGPFGAQGVLTGSGSKKKAMSVVCVCDTLYIPEKSLTDQFHVCSRLCARRKKVLEGSAASQARVERRTGTPHHGGERQQAED